MPADSLDVAAPSAPANAEALRHFVDYACGQPGMPALNYDDVAGSSTRAELGISSLDMLILIAGYIDATAAGRAMLQPEWVPLLDDVAGIGSVVAEIDRLAAGGS